MNNKGVYFFIFNWYVVTISTIIKYNKSEKDAINTIFKCTK